MIIEKNKSMREKVYDILKKMIIDGKILPGERIIETEYSKQFQISRTPIREAIRMLELEGFLESNSTGGVTVKQISAKDIEEVYKIRIALESVILEEIISNIEKKDISNLEKILDDTKNALSNNYDDNSSKMFNFFSEFNEKLYDLSDYNKVTDMIKKLNLYLERFRKFSIGNPLRKKDAFNDHVLIFQAIKEKNLEKALHLNRLHLEKSMNFNLTEIKP